MLKYLPPLSGPSSVPNQGGYFRSFRLSLLHVRDSLCQNGLNMIIAQRIVYCFSVFSTLDQPRLLQKTKLMRYRGLAHVQQRRNITDTQLRRHKRRQYPQAGLVISSAGIALRAAITASVWTICSSQHSSSASVCFADNLIPPAICAYLFNL